MLSKKIARLSYSCWLRMRNAPRWKGSVNAFFGLRQTLLLGCSEMAEIRIPRILPTGDSDSASTLIRTIKPLNICLVIEHCEKESM